jgi:hypothetical protein
MNNNKASEAMYKAWESARVLYRQYSTLARVLFKNDTGTLSNLGLDKDQASTLAKWVTQANQFYNFLRKWESQYLLSKKFKIIITRSRMNNQYLMIPGPV